MKSQLIIGALFVGLVVVALMPAPVEALPPCSAILSEICPWDCYAAGLGSCLGMTGGRCGVNSQPYTLICSGGTLDGWCSCGSGGCFLEGTEITMADGTRKRIEDIEAGDEVLAYQESDGEMRPEKVKSVHDPAPAEYHIVVNGAIRLTASHPMLSDGKWVEIGELKVGDSLTRADGTTFQIETLETVKEDVTVYNFSVDVDETYVADGVVVHNKPPDITQEP